MGRGGTDRGSGTGPGPALAAAEEAVAVPHDGVGPPVDAGGANDGMPGSRAILKGDASLEDIPEATGSMAGGLTGGCPALLAGSSA